MKKYLILFTIIIVSFFCTACINNIAIQELNQMGIDYLNKGDIDGAISRFQSSVDLDDNIYESHFNLGVAFIQKQDNDNAIIHLKKATEINPKAQDAYRSLAIAYENKAFDFDNIEGKEKRSKEDVIVDINLINEAIFIYETYLSFVKEKAEIENVQNHINELKNTIDNYKKEYQI